MKRHLFEFMDLPGVPKGLRGTLREILECGNALPFRPYYKWVAAEVLRCAREGKFRNIVELGAGTGAVTRRLARDSRSAGITLVVCDVNPDVLAYEDLERRYPGKVRARYSPIDFSKPQKWGADTLLFLSATFHHIPPEARAGVLASLTKSAGKFMIFEPLRKNLLSALFVLLSIVPALLLPVWDFLRPGRLRRLFWCWLFPAAPFLFLWDGLVSCLRQWTNQEWREELERLGCEARVARSGFSQAIVWSPKKVAGRAARPAAFASGRKHQRVPRRESPCAESVEQSPGPDRARGRRTRVLFEVEAVTLGQVGRSLALAEALDPAHYEVVLACHPRFSRLLPDLPFSVRPLRSIPSAQFLHALATGSPTHDLPTLRGYVSEDLEILRDVAPDVVIGDFRLSLSVSARLTRTPYVAIVDGCWSPYAQQKFPLAEHPLTRVVGTTNAQPLFRIVRPLAFAYHAIPLNRLRQEYGLPPLGYDLRRVYTDADCTLYAGLPELTPTHGLPAHHHYLGPILWSPTVPRPDWWEDLPADRPIVYVSLGSAGKSELLPSILEALADLPVTVVAATAGRIRLGSVPKNAFAADYLRGEEVAARARLVICNGGSPATHQALSRGVPVLGIASNMNQLLNMQPIRYAGAGELLRAGRATVPILRATAAKMLDLSGYADAAAALARTFSRHHAPARFRDLVAGITAGSSAAA